MKCGNCGFENNNKAKFCTRCGNLLVSSSQQSNNSKYIVICLVIVIIILVSIIGYMALNLNSQNMSQSNSQNQLQNQVSSPQQSPSDSFNSQRFTEAISQPSKSWQSIGKYSGSGSGSQTVDVPSGQIMIKISAFPIKNHATNHLYVTGTNGEFAGVDWGSTSKVATKSDSIAYNSSSSETFTIDFNETVSWEVEFFRYQ